MPLLDDDCVYGFPQPARIRAARYLRGLTQPEVVRQMRRPVTAAALSQIEAGRVTPTERTVGDLASALGVPVGFFFAQWADTLAAQSAEPPTFFRDLASTPVRERRKASALALVVSDLVAAIGERVRLPEFSLPNYKLAIGAPDEEIEAVAETLRDEWDLGNGPIPNVVREVERRGVPIACLTLGGDAVDAFSVRYARRPVMLLQDKNYVRSRFDVSHELAHLIGHEMVGPRDKRVENQAHRFAGAFLFPREHAHELLPRRMNADGWRRLAEIKSQWGVSMGALLERGKQLGVIAPEVHRSARRYMAARGWHRHEPGDREMGPPERPVLLHRAIRTVEEECRLSVQEFVFEANLPLDDTLRLLAASDDRRPAVALQ